MTDISGYRWHDANHTCAHDYVLPYVTASLEKLQVPEKRLFDLGCGNGSVAHMLTQIGWEVTGVDPSVDGIAQAKRRYPSLRLEQGSAYDDLAARYGFFPIVLSLEVVEHVYNPRKYAATLFSLIEPGGTAVVSTPYHGYFKNLALAVTGRMDDHFTALWDHGHIKFWSVKTLTALLREAGFVNFRVRRVGRFPALAKSMIILADRPV
jgi:2-polyprenyl-6-hydroxyphenyl methylase/3-demethylubiquinone-9 3-methyltransferase